MIEGHRLEGDSSFMILLRGIGNRCSQNEHPSKHWLRSTKVHSERLMVSSFRIARVLALLLSWSVNGCSLSAVLWRVAWYLGGSRGAQPFPIRRLDPKAACMNEMGSPGAQTKSQKHVVSDNPSPEIICAEIGRERDSCGRYNIIYYNSILYYVMLYYVVLLY